LLNPIPSSSSSPHVDAPLHSFHIESLVVPALILSNDPGPSNNPRIDTSGSNVAVQWESREPFSSVPHWEVVFAGSTDGGLTFSSKTSVSGNRFPTSDSTLNDIAILGNNLYSTWTVFENDNFNVYFAKGILSSAIPPAEGIQKLIDTINSMNIAKSTKTSLNGPLHNAIKLLTDNDPTNDADVCSKLDSFIAQVNSKEANGQLTSQQAANLRQQATSIQDALGCSSSSSSSSPSSISGMVGYIVNSTTIPDINLKGPMTIENPDEMIHQPSSSSSSSLPLPSLP
jgi:hypothetical protein